MPACELCGRTVSLVLAEIEEVELNVCAECAKHGIVKRRIAPVIARAKPVPKEEPEYVLVPHYASLLRSAREQGKLSQQDFAKLLNEKESSIAKWEAGILKPSIETARKLEKKLGLKLVEVEETASGKVEIQSKGGELTLGDLVKIRKRR